jgi:hypothetical protein
MVPLLWAGRISNQAYSPECVEGNFSEVRRHGVLRSSAIIYNQGVGKGPARVRPFAPYAAACISERVSEHETSTKKIGQLWLAEIEAKKPASLKMGAKREGWS